MSGSTQSGDGSTTTQLDPDIKKLFTDYAAQAKTTSQGLLKSNVPDQNVAGLTSDQVQAGNLLQQQLKNNVPEQTVHSAVNTAQDAAHYDPSLVNANDITGRKVEYITGDPTTAGTYHQAEKNTVDRGAVSNVDAGSVLDHLGQYKDATTRALVDTTMSDLERQRKIAQQSDKASAIAAHAFGGSREGVAKSLTNEAYDRTAASTLADLNNKAFTQATALSDADKNRDLTAQGQNQQADEAVFGHNADLKQQVELSNTAGAAARQDFNAQQKQAMDAANMAAGNAARSQTAAQEQQARVQNAQNDITAQQSNQAAGLNANGQAISAAGLLGSLGSQEKAMNNTDVQSLLGIGGMQQDQQQKVLDAATTNATAERNNPVQALQVLGSPFSNLPTMGSGGTSNSTSSGKGVGI